MSARTPAPITHESLDNYIVRSYEKCRGNKQDEEAMTVMLREEVQQATKTGQTNRDWTKHPLPLLPNEKLKQSTLSLSLKDRMVRPDQTFVPKTFNNVNKGKLEPKQSSVRQHQHEARAPVLQVRKINREPPPRQQFEVSGKQS